MKTVARKMKFKEQAGRAIDSLSSFLKKVFKKIKNFRIKMKLDKKKRLIIMS